MIYQKSVAPLRSSTALKTPDRSKQCHCLQFAYPIIWKNADFYDDHIVMIVSFHLICAYLKMIAKK